MARRKVVPEDAKGAESFEYWKSHIEYKRTCAHANVATVLDNRRPEHPPPTWGIKRPKPHHLTPAAHPRGRQNASVVGISYSHSRVVILRGCGGNKIYFPAIYTPPRGCIAKYCTAPLRLVL